MRPRAGILELITKPGRCRYYLNERPLSGGDIVELNFSEGWVAGRYEWSTDPTDPPRFHYSIQLQTVGEVAQGSLPIPPGALLRWPAPSGA